MSTGTPTYRQIWILGCVSLVLCGGVSLAAPPSEQLCTLWARVGGERVDLASTSGEAVLDRQLALEASRLAEVFGVNPGLKVVTGPASYSANAIALSRTLVEGTEGTVGVGRELMFSELRENHRGWGGLVVAGFMAHEFAHIFQFFSDYHGRLSSLSSTVEPVELHADFLAGYYLGRKRRDGAEMDIKAFMDGAYMLGDYNETSASHHGTSPERMRAVREGYRTGVEGKSMASAAESGVLSVQQIMRTRFER